MVAITRVGMTTAVGSDARTSAAAFRAGIARKRVLDYFEYFSEAEGELVPIFGQIAEDGAVEAEGFGKMLGLSIGAFRDFLRSEGQTQDHEGARTGCYLALPNYSLRKDNLVDEIEYDDEMDSSLSAEFVQQCDCLLWDGLMAAVGAHLNVVVKKNTYGNGSAFLQALREAVRDLETGTVDRCILGGIDSYLDPFSLSWAIRQQRLKCSDAPCGFSPGEAAVFVQLELLANAGARCRAILSRPEISGESSNIEAGMPPAGRGLASTITSLLSKAPETTAGVVISDMNGEADRAQDWGCALNRLLKRFPYLNEAPVWCPADSFGETGCAGPGLAMGLAVQAFERGYAKTDCFLIWCSSDTGVRSAVLVSRLPHEVVSV